MLDQYTDSEKRKMLAIGLIAVVVVIIIVMLPYAWAAIGGLRQPVDENTYIENHTSDPITVAPSIRGIIFNPVPRAYGSTQKINGWFYSERIYTGKLYDPQENNEGGLAAVTLPVLSQVTNATYSTEVIGRMPIESRPDNFADIQSVKCWTNNMPEKPVQSVYSGPLTLTITVEYLNPQGEPDPLNRKNTCSFDANVYIYRDDFVSDRDVGPYIYDFTDTYVYVPFNIRPRYSLIKMTIQGEYQTAIYKKDLGNILGGFTKVSDTGVQKLLGDEYSVQPTQYRWPLEYNTDEGIIGGGRP